jgi:hypothetical protein
VVLRLMRTLESGGFVKRQINVLGICPSLAVNFERQTGSAEFGLRIAAKRTVDANITGFDAQATNLAAAETLGLQKAFEVHGVVFAVFNLKVVAIIAYY